MYNLKFILFNYIQFYLLFWPVVIFQENVVYLLIYYYWNQKKYELNYLIIN